MVSGFLRTVRRVYQRLYTLHLAVTAALFLVQLIHLTWLFTAVVLPRLQGEPPRSSTIASTLFYVLSDYAEIPALASATLLYLYELGQQFRLQSLAYLLLVNTQWVHLLWITDEVVVYTLTQQQFLVWPELLAWAAILIDYLEVPVILDTLYKLYLRRGQLWGRVRRPLAPAS